MHLGPINSILPSPQIRTVQAPVDLDSAGVGRGNDGPRLLGESSSKLNSAQFSSSLVTPLVFFPPTDVETVDSCGCTVASRKPMHIHSAAPLLLLS